MNNNIRKALLLFALAALAAASSSQTLSLRQCRDKALEHNKSLSAARVELERTRYDMQAYRANFFPKLHFIATDFYSTARGDFSIDGGQLPIYNYVESAGQFVPNVTVNPDGSYKLNQYADFPSQKMKWKLQNIFVGGVTLMEPIYAGGKITAAYDMSRLGVGMAHENIRLTESEVIVNTDEAYFLAVKAQQLGEVARSYKSMLDEVMKNVEGAQRHGMSTRNDVMKVQVKLNEAELSIRKADNAYRLALMNLCHVCGIPLDSEISVDADALTATDPASPSASSTLLSACGDITARPEFAILQHKTDLARKNVKLAKSEFLPNVAVGAAYTYANGGELAGKQMLSNGAATVGVVVKIPISVFGDAAGKVRSANAACQIAQLEQQDLNERMQLELAQCRNNVDEAQDEVRLCETALRQAAENVRLSKQQYDVGFETLSDYLATQAVWQQCSSDLVNARLQLQLSLTRLQKAAGTLRKEM